MKLRQIRIILGFLVLVISFQNCNAPNTTTMPQKTDTSSSSKSRTITSTGGSSSSGNSSLSSGSARGATGGSSSAGGSGTTGTTIGSGGTSSGGNSSSSGSGTCIGCGSSGGGGSSGTGTIGGGGDNTFKITKQPIATTINENESATIGISVQGGVPPYTYKWYLNDVEVPPLYGTVHYSSYTVVMDRVYKDGEYHVTVTDGKGALLKSSKALVQMTARACSAGNYFMLLNPNSSSGQYMADAFYYNGKKYLAGGTVGYASMMNLNGNLGILNYMGFGYFKLNGSASNRQSFSIDCSTDVPTIHASQCATNNIGKCAYNYDNGGYSASKTYEGAVNFVCRNGYLEFVSNSCRLVDPPPPPPGSGNDGGNGA